MPLPHYGVLAGQFSRFEKEPPNNYGKWFHGYVYVTANGVEYQCAVDVNSPTGDFTYTILPDLDPSFFTNVSGLADGYHELPHTAASGAIDYIRSPMIQRAEGCLAAVLGLINKIFGTKKQEWTTNDGDDVLTKLKDLVTGSERVYVFGAPYNTGHGMHDVHYNQGDPAGSQWWASDGTWQDGCVIVKKPGEQFLWAYLGRFVSQSLTTDSNGHPT